MSLYFYMDCGCVFCCDDVDQWHCEELCEKHDKIHVEEFGEEK